MSNNNLVHLLEELAYVSEQAQYGEITAHNRVRELVLELRQAGWKQEQVHFLIRELHSPENYPVRGTEYKKPAPASTEEIELELDTDMWAPRKVHSPSEEVLITELIHNASEWMGGSTTVGLTTVHNIAYELGTKYDWSKDEIENTLRANVEGYGVSIYTQNGA